MTATSPRRRVLIAGGTSGIGLACAQRLATAGAAVWVLGSAGQTAAAACHRLPLAGAGACDIADQDQVEAAVTEAAEHLGGFDGVFISAGIDGLGQPATELDIAHFRRVLDVNVIGTYLVVRAALPALARPGSLVLNASVNALRPEPRFLDYNASKAAVVSMAKTLALELSADGVSVTALCPGYFPTRMTQPYLGDETTAADLLARIPARRFGNLHEIAALVDFLLSPAAAFMTGGVITIDGGSSI
jgi:NAD(P)-dependent dehydrogenase (short-subunit alcohol dehydrogenase family)